MGRGDEGVVEWDDDDDVDVTFPGCEGRVGNRIAHETLYGPEFTHTSS